MDQTVVDVVSASLTYTGTAPIGTPLNSTGWSLKRTSVSGGVTTTDYPIGAGGSPTDDTQFIWSERALYNYSPSSKDTTPPTLPTVSIASDNDTPTLAIVGDVVTITMVANEQLEEPVVRICGNLAATVLGADHKHWTATYTMAAGDSTGLVPFNISFSDIAGNAGVMVKTVTDGSSVTFDKTAPTLPTVTIASNNADTARAKSGDVVTLTIVVSDELTTKPTVTIAGHAIDPGNVTEGIDGAHYTATYTMVGGDTNGVVPFTIDFTDPAGIPGVQVTTTTNASTVTFDKTVPTLPTVTMASNNVDTTKAKTGDIITLTFIASESLKSKPTVAIAGHSIAGGNVVQGVDASHWTATYTMVGGDSNGAIAFTINGFDLAGNALVQVTAVTSGSAVTFDKTVPTLASATRTSNTVLNVVISELVKAAGITKSNDGGFVVKETGAPGTVYAVSAVAPGVDNTHAVLTVANMAASNVAGVTVTYVAAGNGTVQDLAANPLATDATGVVVAPW